MRLHGIGTKSNGIAIVKSPEIKLLELRKRIRILQEMNIRDRALNTIAFSIIKLAKM